MFLLPLISLIVLLVGWLVGCTRIASLLFCRMVRAASVGYVLSVAFSSKAFCSFMFHLASVVTMWTFENFGYSSQRLLLRLHPIR